MPLLQISEPGQEEQEKQEETIIGIDLGTTNSLVTIIENDEIKILSDENGQNIIPSIVTYDENGKAINIGKKPTTNNQQLTTISSIKRLMGKSFADVKSEELPFEITNENGLSIVIGNKKIRPEEISTEILKHLKNIAEANLKTEVKKAVITVPAYFDEAAKNATKHAANLANLEVIRLVNEPTAAALAYGLDNSSEGIYAVYDLGGGTFDISILKMQKGVFKVLGVLGDNHLGGDDFDNVIAKELNISQAEARKAKEDLSSKDSSQNLTRQKFEELISPQISKTINLTQNLIEDLDLEAEEIKGVILVGGSTRVPLVKKELAKIFSEEKILTNLDPDRVVTIGAAWQAYNLSGKGNNLLLDVTPLSLGIEMMGGITDKIIHRNTTIPTAYAKEFTTYADDQTGMKFHIVQGERELASDCRSLANFEIKGIPPMKAGLARILVTFKVDADGLLTISAKEQVTGQTQEIEVKPTYSLDENQVKEMLLDSLKNSKSDIAQRVLIEAINDATHDITIIKKDLKELKGIIDKDEEKLIREKLEKLEKLLEERNDREAILQTQEELGKAAENIVLMKVNAVLSEKVSGKTVDDFDK